MAWRGSCGSGRAQREGHLGSPRSQPQARPHSPGFQHQGDRSPGTSGCKNKQGPGRRKKLLDFHHLKGQPGLRTYANPPTPGFTTGAAAGRGASHTQEEGEVTGNRMSTWRTTRIQVQELSPLKHSPHSHKGAKWVAPPWQLPKALPTRCTGASST